MKRKPPTKVRAKIRKSPARLVDAGSAANLVASLGAAVERRDRRGPDLAVAGKALRTQVGAKGEELGKGPDDLDVTERDNADQPVGVEVVAEEERRARRRTSLVSTSLGDGTTG